MRQRILYGTNQLVDEFTQKLQKIEDPDGGWTVKFKDTATGEYWIRYVVDLGRGYFYNLMKTDPSPTTDELIAIAMKSKFNDEVSAAATRLYLNEDLSHEEYREKLISKLKEFDFSRLNENDKRRINTIIKAGQLTNRVNQRSVIGKNVTQIGMDSQFYNRIADETEKIMEWIK
ncbi:MAG: hypothetical protein AAF944_21500 [Bacteroidota bacterium]